MSEERHSLTIQQNQQSPINIPDQPSHFPLQRQEQLNHEQYRCGYETMVSRMLYVPTIVITMVHLNLAAMSLKTTKTNMESLLLPCIGQCEKVGKMLVQPFAIT